MPYYDEVFKHLADIFPEAIASLALQTPDVLVREQLSTEQPTIKLHESDLTFKVELPEGETILHIEVQTDENRDKPMPLRMLAYSSFLVHRYEVPVYSVVLYLRPPAGRNDPGEYGYGDPAHRGLWIKYPVIKLYELEGEPFLSGGSIGLLPFTALMKPPSGMDTERWIRECVSRTHAAAVDSQTRGTLLFALSLFGSLAHDSELFEDLITEEIMQESPLYQRIMQRGETRAKRDALLKLIGSQFDVVPEGRIRQIEKIESLSRLDSLFDQALRARSLDEMDWEDG